jgi:capsular polysaccharide biosynthesis protein
VKDEGMELRTYFRILVRWWWLILLPPLVAGAYAFLSRPPASPVFAATLRFTAGQPQTQSASGYDPNYYRWLASEYIVGGLKDWVRTGAFAEAVSAELAARGLNLPAGSVAGALAGADNQRSILLVYLSWPNDKELITIAEAVTTVLQTRNAEIFPQLGGQPAAVTPLDKPSVGPAPASLRARFDWLIKTGLGLGVGLALALAAHYLDPRIKEKDELEQLGLRVVAEIPKERRPKPKT